MDDYFRRYMWYLWHEVKKKSEWGHSYATPHYITHMLYLIMYVQSRVVIGVFDGFFYMQCYFSSKFYMCTQEVFIEKEGE